MSNRDHNGAGASSGGGSGSYPNGESKSVRDAYDAQQKKGGKK